MDDDQATNVESVVQESNNVSRSLAGSETTLSLTPESTTSSFEPRVFPFSHQPVWQSSSEDEFENSSTASEAEASPATMPKRTRSKRIKRAIDPGMSPEEVRKKMFTFDDGDSSPGDGRAAPSTSTVLELSSTPEEISSMTTQGNQFSLRYASKKPIAKCLPQEVRRDSRPLIQQKWKQVESGLMKILKDEDRVSRGPLYWAVQILCRLRQGSRLFALIEKRFEEYVTRSLRDPLIRNAKSHGNIAVMKESLVAWKKWNDRLKEIFTIFIYLDSSLLLSTSGGSRIIKSGRTQFRDIVYRAPALKERILQGTCDYLNTDRDYSSEYDSDILKDIVKMFNDLTLYSTDFEPFMLGASQEYIRAWSAEKAQQPLVNYVKDIVTLRSREMKRCDVLGLENSTKRNLLEKLDDLAIDGQKDSLLSKKGIVDILTEGDVDTLKDLFHILQRRNYGRELKPAIEAYIINEGSAIIFDQEQIPDMVVRLLLFKSKVDDFHRVALDKNPELEIGIRDAFAKFINQKRKGSVSRNTAKSAPGEMIAKYVDVLLREGIHGIPKIFLGEKEFDIYRDEEEEVEKQLDAVLSIFRFLRGKAVFEAFYKRDLARRLLIDRSASVGAERAMLQKLRGECGALFTLNLENMFQDMTLAREESKAFKEHMEDTDQRLGVDLHVSVLSSSSWPSYPHFPVKMPPVIQSALEKFEAFYHTQHNGRQLTWMPNLSRCHLKTRFQNGSKELILSGHQAVVLLLFNDVPPGGRLTFTELLDGSGLPEDELKSVLQSFCLSKTQRILCKRPRGLNIGKANYFAFNYLFTSPRYRVRINTVQIKDAIPETEEIHEHVVRDRHFETQAVIVKIMKSRKVISHNELIAEVIKRTESRGELQIQEIKDDIGKLIDKEYIDRNEKGGYKYLA